MFWNFHKKGFGSNQEPSLEWTQVKPRLGLQTAELGPEIRELGREEMFLGRSLQC
jgi:hypothetical protein